MTISQMLREQGDQLGLEAADLIDALKAAAIAAQTKLLDAYTKRVAMTGVSGGSLKDVIDQIAAAVSKAEEGHL